MTGRDRGPRVRGSRIRTSLAAVIVGVTTVGLLPARGAEAVDTGPDPSVSRSDETGRVTFLGTRPGQPLDSGVGPAAAPESAARSFLAGNVGTSFGIRDSDLRVTDVAAADRGRHVVRFQQVHEGIPVLGGELVVNLTADNEVLAASGEASPDLTVDVRPELTAAEARDIALGATAKSRVVVRRDLTATAPELWIYDHRLLGAPGALGPRLVWRTEVTSRQGDPLRRLVLVDADRGAIALAVDQVESARTRHVCDAANSSAKYPCTPALASRSEGQAATGIADVDLAYDYAGDTYDFLQETFGRDSLDGAGMPLVSTVRFCDGPCPFENAFWDGTQMVYGTGFAGADDVVGHEFQHGVTDFGSHLFYYAQSGAINESLSDIFGEFVDLTNGAGDDSAGVRWLLGEDLPIGAIRDMQDPTLSDQPDRMQSPLYYGGEGDALGVHTNSGVGNKAAYLLTDGGTFNGRTVTGQGITRTAKIFYEANDSLLVSGSDYADLADALRQACTNLLGTSGIDAATCTEVDDALLATQMDQSPANAPAPGAPYCAGGAPRVTHFADDLENPGLGRWVASGGTWYYPQTTHPYGGGWDPTYATSGSTNFWGDDPSGVSDSTIAMTANVLVPAGSTFLRYNSAWGFEDDSSGNYDGGILEYSTNNGSTWSQLPGARFTHNGYTGTIATGYGNPLAGRTAFVGESNGYRATRADLSHLAGQNVRLRFRVASDQIFEDYGWFVDDIEIFGCTDTTAPVAKPPVPSFVLRSTLGKNPAGASIPHRISWPAGTDDTTLAAQLTYQLAESVNGGPFVAVGGFASRRAVTRPLTPGKTYRYRVTTKDLSGNVSAPVAGPSFKPVVRQENAKSIKYSAGWLARRAVSTAYGGFLRPTTRVNATATTTFGSARGVAVVMPLAASLGKARICLTRGSTTVACSTVDLSPASGRGARKVVFARSNLSPAATYKLVVKDTAGRAELDAIVLDD